MKILVTGATGFIGGRIVHYLSNIPNTLVIATGRTVTTQFDDLQNVDFVSIDLTQLTEKIDADICIHCAGLADDNSSEDELNLQNVIATKNLLASLNGCKKFIYISSSSVYDFSDGKIKSEADASLKLNLSEYGKSKLKAEDLVNSSQITSVFILRPRAVYGKGDRVLLPRIIGRIKNQKMILPGKLLHSSSLTHVDNLISMVHSCIDSPQKGTNIYNVADEKPYVMQSVFKTILFENCGSKRIVIVPEPVVRFYLNVLKLFKIKSSLSLQSLNYLTQQSILSLDKAKGELSYQPKKDFFSSLSELEFSK